MDPETLAAVIGAVGAVAAAIVAAFVPIIAKRLQRQISVKTTEMRLKAYADLWSKMEPARPSRLEGPEPDPISAEEREALYDDFTKWYFENGNGMLLGQATRNLYLLAKWNLVCAFQELKPDVLQTEEREKDGNERGRLSMRQLSLLRTRMKADLEIFGRYFFGPLSDEDKAFLERCGEDPKRQPWRGSNVTVQESTQADA